MIRQFALKQLITVHKRNFCTGIRLRGYVNSYSKEKNCGFIVANENPEIEYYFDAQELQTKDVHHIRSYQPVEFEVAGANHTRAVQITSPNGKLLSYIVNSQKKTNRHTQELFLSDKDDVRHRGIVYIAKKEYKHGWIQSKLMNTKTIKFEFADLNCTGTKSIRPDSEVEFRVQKRAGDKLDYAFDITRPGGGLITAEIKEVGVRRRMLGEKYRPSDIYAEYDETRPRLRGTVTHFDHVKLTGNIWCEDHPARNCFFHLDDCHIKGSRYMRFNQQVEFSLEPDQGNATLRVSDITAPGGMLISQSHSNLDMPREKRTKQLKPGKKRHRGIIRTIINPKTSKTYYGFIVPDENGCADIFFPGQEIVATDRREILEKSVVEFDLLMSDDKETYTASNITGPDGVPITIQGGPVGAFYRKHGQTLASLEPYPETEGILTGFVCRYNQSSGNGLIEITSADKRYSRVPFNRTDLKFDGEMPKYMSQWFVDFKVKDGGAVDITSVGEDDFQVERIFGWADLEKCFEKLK